MKLVGYASATFLGLTLPVLLLLTDQEDYWLKIMSQWHTADSGGHWHIEPDAPGALVLKPHAPSILKEFQAFKANVTALGMTLPPAHSIDPTQGSFYGDSSGKLQWSLLPLRLFGADMPLQALFPAATRLLNDLPHAEAMTLSVLPANSTINLHSGVLAAVQRCTIYIDAPHMPPCNSTHPCSPDMHAHFKIVRPAMNHNEPTQTHDTVLYTSAATSFCFWDMHTHGASNPTAHDRVALLVDYSLPLSGVLAGWSAGLLRLVGRWHPRLRAMRDTLATLVQGIVALRAEGTIVR